MLHVVPLKLYGVSCKPVPAPSLAELIVKLHALHSLPFALANVKVGAVASFVYTSVSIKLVLQLLSASQEIALSVVVALNDWLLHVVELAVGSTPFVVYLTTVPHAHALQLIVLVLQLNQYPLGVHVGAAVGYSVSI